ncbi:hypothetical protein [Streptomyces sp. S.PNR 29]|uniref:hypothetical protein n=1 Tax=Streptomyces sp. S.PNR 29 TaxID=2973805 RepID=UPI0025B0BEB8|nr:hypothetical protein [Streptomyces sp. S.PNR 29]MDN0195238.1 hypothetical protein [Streptomyces sp. S.PNR 29]
MARTTRIKARGLLTALAAVAALGATAVPADAAAQGIERWHYCSLAPDGALVADYDTVHGDDSDMSVCWSGSGRATNPDRHGELRQVHTADNRGSLQLKTGARVWDLPFDRNQTHDIPQDTILLGLSLNE